MEEIFTGLTDSLQSSFKKSKGSFFGARTVITLLSFIFAIAFYTYVVEFYDPDSNIWSYFRFSSKTYTFYSGSPGGLYIEVGNLLESKSQDNDRINVRNQNTSGGSENALKVITTPNSFGLVQEETLRENDIMRKQINYITPLYLERIHIIYRKDRFKSLSDNPPQLSASSPDDVLRLFGESKIAAGPVGSGTRVIASYIMSEVNRQIKENPNVSLNNQNILNISFSQGLNMLEQGGESVDILFTIAGAPLKTVKEILATGQYEMISILPSFVTNINRDFGVHLRMSDFNNIYQTEGRVATLGSYSYLIASKEVNNTDILELLTILDANKDEIRTQFDIKLGDHFQLDEFDFLNLFQSKHELSMMQDIKNILLFIVSFSISTAVSGLFLLWITSSRKQARYFKEITSIHTDNIPVNSNLDESNTSLPKPIIYENQIAIINKVIVGISKLFELNKVITEDYNTGGITDKHQNHLLKHIENTIFKLQKNLCQRLNELFERGESLSLHHLRAYYTAGYLIKDDYEWLMERMKNQPEPVSLPPTTNEVVEKE